MRERVVGHAGGGAGGVGEVAEPLRVVVIAGVVGPKTDLELRREPQVDVRTQVIPVGVALVAEPEVRPHAARDDPAAVGIEAPPGRVGARLAEHRAAAPTSWTGARGARSPFRMRSGSTGG